MDSGRMNLGMIKTAIKLELLHSIDFLLKNREKEIKSDEKFEKAYCQAIQDVIKILEEVL